MDEGSTYREELKKFLQKKVTNCSHKEMKGTTVKFTRQKYNKICQHILENIRTLLREPTAAHFYEKQLHDWAKPPEYVSRYFLSSGAHGHFLGAVGGAAVAGAGVVACRGNSYLYIN
ncbi:hypothetical protein K438DRAFT_1927297 [Mycena galopus ATCC 62051]|nr:hypothetical protein K438DRAFT_1927297 [Mycena galopus ATCC 62051]